MECVENMRVVTETIALRWKAQFTIIEGLGWCSQGICWTDFLVYYSPKLISDPVHHVPAYFRLNSSMSPVKFKSSKFVTLSCSFSNINNSVLLYETCYSVATELRSSVVWATTNTFLTCIAHKQQGNYLGVIRSGVWCLSLKAIVTPGVR